MAVSSTRSVQVTMSGDIQFSETFVSTTNAASPAQIQVVSLSSGNNTITPPSGAGITPVAVMILPLSSVLVTLKGVAADTGVPLSKTDYTVVALDSSFTSLVLNAASTVVVRLIWL